MLCRKSKLQFHLHARTRSPFSFFSLSSALYPKLRSIYRDEIRHCCFCDPGALRPLFIHRLFRRIHGRWKFTSWAVTFSNIKCRGSCFACIISRIRRIRSPAVRPGILLSLVSVLRGQMHSLKYLLDHASRNGNAAMEHASSGSRLHLGISFPKFRKARDF